jgi:hypothetical protein
MMMVMMIIMMVVMMTMKTFEQRMPGTSSNNSNDKRKILHSVP